MKKIIALVLCIILMISLSTIVQAEVTLTDDDKAGVLNQIDILRGDGVDYNLSGQLKRSEAAAFIVRLVGMDNEVTSNKGTYLQFDYTDVESHQWYAPYVGYCSTVGIISGFDDGTFRPDDYVSEQAFLKMLLTALGYEYNVDFVWSTVFASSYNLKIVNDSSYETRTTDNYEYTRGDVVKSLFNTLMLKKKSTDSIMIQYFIDNEVISAEYAAGKGLIENDIDTDIVSVESLENNRIHLVLNEDIATLTLEDVIIFNKDNNNDQLAVDQIETGATGNEFFIISKDNILPDRQYGIILSDIEDMMGNTTSSITDEFIGYRSENYESNFFMIKDIVSIDSKSIKVDFTHPVNDNILLPKLFELYSDNVLVAGGEENDLTISAIKNEPYSVLVTFKDYTFTEEKTFRLNVDGEAISQYNVKLNDGVGDFATFVSKVVEEKDFELLLINSENLSSIILYFSKDLNPVIAEQVFSYYVTDSDGDPKQISDAEVLDEGYSVRLTFKTDLVDGKTYNIMINHVNDITREHSIVEQEESFTVDKREYENLAINNVYASDAGVIVVKVSRPLDVDSANDPDNYYVKGKTKSTYAVEPEAVFYDPSDDPLIVKLYLPASKAMTKGHDYEVQLKTSLLDENGNKQTTIIKEEFENTKSIIKETYIEEAVVVGSNTVKLSFSREIALDVPNVLNTNYSLSYNEGGESYTKTPLSANYIDARTIIVTFNELSNAIDYEITFDSLVDYAGIVTDNSSTKYLKELEW